MANNTETINFWNLECNKHLVGKTIKNVRYMTDKEMNDMGWYKKPLVIFFNDGSYMYASSDDEGNDAGALFTSIEGLETIPTI